MRGLRVRDGGMKIEGCKRKGVKDDGMKGVG